MPEVAGTKQTPGPDVYAWSDGNKVIKYYIIRVAVPLLGFPLYAEPSSESWSPKPRVVTLKRRQLTNELLFPGFLLNIFSPPWSRL